MNSPMMERRSDGGPDPDSVVCPPALAKYDLVELASGLILLPGQGCRDPQTNACVGITRGATGEIESYDIRAQTEGVFRNVEALLMSRGLNRSNIVDVTVFMRSKGDFNAMNEVWNAFFADCEQPPARTTVFVVDLPGDNFIEMKAQASRIARVE